MLQDKDRYFGGVAEPYWLNSKGIALWVPEGIPLHYSWNAHDTADQMCFEAKNSPPYENDLNVVLAYKICSMDNPKTMHLYAINDFLGKPIGIPDEKMIRDPIWSSWAQYKANINQSTILNFAQTIHDYGFKVSQIEIGKFLITYLYIFVKLISSTTQLSWVSTNRKNMCRENRH